MALNQTTLIRSIEMDLGYKFTDLEITHEEMLDVIRARTLPTFSKYYPYQNRIVVNRETDLVKGYKNRFHLRTENEIININKVFKYEGGTGSGNEVFGLTPRPGYTSGINNMVSNQVMTDLNSNRNPVTWLYIVPNMMEISSVIGRNMLVELNEVHDDSFLTIPVNMQDYFMRLAVADIKMALYPMRSRFQNLETTFGSMELFVDDLLEGRDERAEVIEEMRASIINTPRRRKIYIG